MKCQQVQTGRTAAISITTNGKFCKEYDQHEDTDLNLIAYVPIHEDDSVAIKWNFGGQAPRVHMDVFIDGVLRITKSFTAQGNRKFGCFGAAYSGIDEIKAFSMKVAPLTYTDRQTGLSGKRASRDGLGTICVEFSVAHEVGDTHNFQSKNNFGPAPQAEEYNRYQHNGIYPTHRIRYQYDPRELRRQYWKSRKTYEEGNTPTRPGLQVWARFIFLYQSLDSLESAGLTKTKAQIFEIKTPTPQAAISAANASTDSEEAAKSVTSLGNESHSSKRSLTIDRETPIKRAKLDVDARRNEIEDKRQRIREMKLRKDKAVQELERKLQEKTVAEKHAHAMETKYIHECEELDKELQMLQQGEDEAIRDAAMAEKEAKRLHEEGEVYAAMLGRVD
ncbi:MAG: hypothetical protein M1820_000463 [Bogoriella megaspora]|nr:MAG: hypothetical protein M1820_000463 [Bogoriella megaspora]